MDFDYNYKKMWRGRHFFVIVVKVTNLLNELLYGHKLQTEHLQWTDVLEERPWYCGRMDIWQSGHDVETVHSVY